MQLQFFVSAEYTQTYAISISDVLETIERKFPLALQRLITEEIKKKKKVKIPQLRLRSGSRQELSKRRQRVPRQKVVGGKMTITRTAKRTMQRTPNKGRTGQRPSHMGRTTRKMMRSRRRSNGMPCFSVLRWRTKHTVGGWNQGSGERQGGIIEDAKKLHEEPQ